MDSSAEAGLPSGLVPGSRVAGYQVEGQLGAGGMAVVFRARDVRLGRIVALKVLAPGLAADAGFRARFIRESQAAAAADDPHILPVYEAGEAGGVLFIAMRFVGGGDLGSVLARDGPLAAGRAAGFVSEVASALDAAHAAGLVHRDVKPANVLVDARPGRPEHVYLADFGLSKGALWSASLTESGVFLGTAAFSAPEQISGRTVDGRADQYALACLAFMLLAGVPPFQRDPLMAVLWAQLSEPPPPLTSLRPDLPAAADEVLGRGLAKEPQDRYPSCGEFAAALRTALGGPPSSLAAVLGPPPGQDAWPGAAGAHQASRQSGQADGGHAAPLARFETPPPSAGLAPDLVTADSAGKSARAAGASGQPAGRRRLAVRVHRRAGTAAVAAIVLAAVAVIATMPHGPAAHKPSATPSRNAAPVRQTIVASRIATLTDPYRLGPVGGVVFSPDGKTLASKDVNSIYLWDIATRTRIATLTDPDSTGAIGGVAFSPDGKTLAAANGDSIYLWDVAARTRIATLTDPGSTGAINVAFSPDGKTLVTADDNGRIYLWDVAARTHIVTLTDPGSKGVSNIAFSPDGKTLAAADYDGSTYLWDIAARTRIATLTDPASEGVNATAFGLGGRTLATADVNGRIYLWDVAARTRIATLTDPGSMGGRYLAFSPDGKTLATAYLNGRIYLWDASARTRIATLTDPANSVVSDTAFSPDGKTLAIADFFGLTYLWGITVKPGHNS
ncbi:MAG: protein kinase [Streptosporangiaceae bacterium]